MEDEYASATEGGEPLFTIPYDRIAGDRRAWVDFGTGTVRDYGDWQPPEPP